MNISRVVELQIKYYDLKFSKLYRLNSLTDKLENYDNDLTGKNVKPKNENDSPRTSVSGGHTKSTPLS
jgi:hypothetical protein